MKVSKEAYGMELQNFVLIFSKIIRFMEPWDVENQLTSVLCSFFGFITLHSWKKMPSNDRRHFFGKILKSMRKASLYKIISQIFRLIFFWKVFKISVEKKSPKFEKLTWEAPNSDLIAAGHYYGRKLQILILEKL